MVTKEKKIYVILTALLAISTLASITLIPSASTHPSLEKKSIFKEFET